MLHPLAIFAAELDRVAGARIPSASAEEPQKVCIKEKLSRLDQAEQYDDLVSTYAAYVSTRIQDERLGSEGVLEEQQTSALFGLLSSSFWHASLIDACYARPPSQSTDTPPVLGSRSKRQWVYQDRYQEVEYGFDFGIITHLPPGENEAGIGHVKITIFQAKRPPNEAQINNIAIRHRVREQTAVHLPAGEQDLRRHERLYKIKLKNAKKLNLNKKNPRVYRLIERNCRWAKQIWSRWDIYKGPSEQREALTAVIAKLQKESLTDTVAYLNSNSNIVELATNRGAGSLFDKDYSYFQYEAFLALAICGWTHPRRVKGCLNWCHYVQWVNGENGESWSASLQTVLRNPRIATIHRTAFSDILAAALSPSDRTIGLILSFEDAGSLTTNLLAYSPNLTWGVTAETKELANQLLQRLCSTHSAPDRARSADTVKQQPSASQPKSQDENVRTR